MIARLRILLPFTLSVREGDELRPHEFDHAGYNVVIYPPCRAAINPADTEAVSPVPARYILEGLRPADPQDATPLVRVDDAPTIQANLLQIDFRKDEFDRRRALVDGVPPDQWFTHGDPSVEFAFALANSFLARVRTPTRGGRIKPVSYKGTFWRLDYLTDTEEIPPFDPQLFRRQLGHEISFHATALNTVVWNQVQALPPDYRPPIWDTLLLDAGVLLPEVGPAIVMTYSALESFIEDALDRLAPLTTIPPDLWKWITERGQEDWRKAPSVIEQFDQLLRSLTNRSLKEDNQLWEALQNLREARNSFTHEGRPVIGDREVTVELASNLVGRASAIVDWVERLLPENVRRPRLERGVTFGFFKPLIVPQQREEG